MLGATRTESPCARDVGMPLRWQLALSTACSAAKHVAIAVCWTCSGSAGMSVLKVSRSRALFPEHTSTLLITAQPGMFDNLTVKSLLYCPSQLTVLIKLANRYF